MRIRIDPTGYLTAQLRPHGMDKHLPAWPVKQAIVYRFRDADDGLLYIGTTVNPPMRWQEHRRKAKWWPLVATVDLEFYDDPAYALDAERAAICAELPPFNRRSIPRSFRRSSAGVPHTPVSGMEGNGREEEWNHYSSIGSYVGRLVAPAASSATRISAMDGTSQCR